VWSQAGGGGGGDGWTVVCHVCGADVDSAAADRHETRCLQRWHRHNDQLPTHQRLTRPPTKHNTMIFAGI